MMKDLVVVLEDHPGTLASMGEILGAAGVNIEGICAASKDGGLVHILVEDAAAARQALGAKSVAVSTEREVLVLDISDRPGSLGEVARKLADAGVNIELIYLATHTRLVLGVDDLEKARAAV
jgi:hypothetical protein